MPGIDVSTYQGDVAWDQVKAAGKVFAFARVSNGTTKLDPTFDKNWKGMKAAGVIRGAYQYFRPAEDAAAQAKIVLDAIDAAGGLQAGDLPPVVDLETADGKTADVVQAQAKIWIDLVTAKIGRKPIVYTAAYLSSMVGTTFVESPLWVANYKVQCPKMPDGWTRWHFWQSADDGVVAGIAGKVDLDVFDGSLDDLRAFTFACAPGDTACASKGDAGAPPPAAPGPDPGPDPIAPVPCR